MKKTWYCPKNRAWMGALAVLLLVGVGDYRVRAEEEPDLEELLDSPGVESAETAALDESELDGLLESEKEGDLAQSEQSSEPIDDDFLDLVDAPAMDPEVETATQEVASPLEPSPEPSRAVAEAVAPAPSKNAVTNLEFRMDGALSRILVSFQSKPVYREVKQPHVKQIVYYFDATTTPQKHQRAYDTTEFASPVALFTLLQMPGADPLTKLIVQLREDTAPTVTTSDNQLRIEFAAPQGSYDPKLVLNDEEGALATEENIYSGGKKYTGETIQKLEMKNIDVQDALRHIARTSGYSIVVGDDVTGKIGTLSLTNVPWDQAFALVLQSKKLGYVRQGNVIRVGTLVSLKSEKEEALANENSRIKVEPLRTVLIPMSYAKAVDMAPKAKSFLTDRGTIDTDQRTNTVIVKDIEKVVNRVQKLMSALDTQPPRVSISAKIVEMQNKFTRTIGFQSLKFNEGLAGINFEETAQFPGVAGSSITTISSSRLARLETKLHLGEAENKVRVLANPSVSVVANQQANVNQSLSFFVQGIEIVNGVVVTSLKQITANLSLDVTPIVSGDGSIFMTVNLRNEIPSGIGSERTIDTRSVSTQVLVENGDTAVIGGVFNNTVTEGKAGIPGLMNIPILGFLFSRTNLEDNRNEIFVFLTAKITNADEAFKRSL